MKKHLQIIVGILILFATSSLYAQSNNAIKKFTQSIRSHKNMEVSFTYQTIGDPNGTEEAKEGKAYFQDKAYKLLMEDQHAISNGKTTWHYIIEDKEVMVGDATDSTTLKETALASRPPLTKKAISKSWRSKLTKASR